jgi:hypothetical protein
MEISEDRTKHLGFTGTRHKLPKPQVKELKRVLKKLRKKYVYLHHGDCVGADAMAHSIAVQLKYKVILHPPSNPKHRAFTDTACYKVHEPKTYLERNHDIVNSTNRLVACPHGKKEENRSGTWYTVRYARMVRRPISIVYG